MLLLQPTEYQPALASRFALVRDRILTLLPNAGIEHIGASAVPGALSKGDLDICVLVRPAEHAATVEALTACGYLVKAGTLRTDQLCMLEWDRADEEHAVQLVARGSAFEMFMVFRDALLARPALVVEYNRVKAMASHLSDTEYRAAKSGFIGRVLDEAGWTSPDV